MRVRVLSGFSHVWLLPTLCTIAHQAPLFMRFCRQEYWSGLPYHPGDLPNPGIKPTSLTSPALAGGFLTTGPLGYLKASHLGVPGGASIHWATVHAVAESDMTEHSAFHICYYRHTLACLRKIPCSCLPMKDYDILKFFGKWLSIWHPLTPAYRCGLEIHIWVGQNHR